MDVIKFERRHKRKRVDGSTESDFTPKQLNFPWFEKTYRRRKENGGGGARKGTGGIDGLHLLATAAAAADESLCGEKATPSAGQVGNLKGVRAPAVLPKNRVVGFPQADPAESTRVLNLHDSVNGKLMEKLKGYLREHDVELGHGWKVRHKTCSGYGTHSYYSPAGRRFTSMPSVRDHLTKGNDGRRSTGLSSDLAKMEGLNQLNTFACPHPTSLLAKRVNPPASAERQVADNGDDKRHHVHHREASAKSVVLRERNGFLISGTWVNQLLDGSHQLLHQEQDDDTCASPKPYTLKAHGRDDNADKFLICDGCKEAYHLHCLPIKLKDVPRGNWYCTSCTAALKESTEPGPADVQSGVECACDHDPCAPCDILDLIPVRTQRRGEEHHCVVCRKLCKLRRPKQRQIKHHCFVCKRLYKLILAKQMHMQAKKKRSEAAPPPEMIAEDLDCHEDGQKSGVCKVCGTGRESDEGIAACSNAYCESRHYHISCLDPPLKEVPPSGWYCHSCLCRACLVDENDDRIVICDDCEDGYHTYCMNPSLLRIPRSKWYCRSCQEKRTHPKVQPLSESRTTPFQGYQKICN
ncbi:unnamed protein product [Victoria cruziana]